MTTTQQRRTVLIGTDPRVTGYERIVAARFDGDDIYIPLDADRAANQALLASPQIFVREPETVDRCTAYDVHDCQPMSNAERTSLEAEVEHSISVATTVVHATASSPSNGPWQPRGFICAIDGSDRAAAALGPARAIAAWYRLPLVILAVSASGQEREAQIAETVHRQLERAAVQRSQLRWISLLDMPTELRQSALQGHAVVCSAFGRWSGPAHLFGMVNHLVASNAPMVIGIGPNVERNWSPAASKPIALFLDGTEHAFDMVRRVEGLLPAGKSPLTLVHIATRDSTDDLAPAVANELRSQTTRTVDVRTVDGRVASDAIAPIASTLDAQLAVLASWHRRRSGSPAVASTSLISVARAHCPVVILSAADSAPKVEV